MPYEIKKEGSDYVVVNTHTGQRRVHTGPNAKLKAERQLRLLRGVEHGFKPTGAPASR